MSVALILKDDVTSFAPQLSVLDPGAWLDILAYVNEFDMTDLGESDQDTRVARIFLAAHLGMSTKLAGSGAAGPVTGESVGGIRRSYGLLSTMSSSSGLASTRYGQMFLDVLGMSAANGPMLV